MYTEEYKEYLKSEKWQHIRNAKLRKVGYKCERCGAKENIQVHHISYDHEFGTERECDLQVLCDECHNGIHMDIECF